MNVLGLIPARGGSRGIPGKNVTPLAGIPLIHHTIRAALGSSQLSRTVVSTDDPEIGKTSSRAGAEVPFLRPAEISGDEADALSVMRHAVTFLDRELGWHTDILVYLQPTSPLRGPEHIDTGVSRLLDSGADTLVSVLEVPHRYCPESLMALEGDDQLIRLTQEGSLRRQDKRPLYARNGPAVLVLKRECVFHDRLYEGRTVGMIMDWRSSIDIDTAADLELAEWLLCRGLDEDRGCESA